MSQYIIIGATGSVGSALAHKLHGLGHELHLVGRNESKLDDLAKELDATYACADACDEHALSQAVIQGCTEDTRGLAYCVGSIDLRPLNKWDMKSLLDVYALNVAGALVAIKNAADTLRKNGGSVVLFSSVAARRGFPQHAGIAAAKAGVEGLTVSLSSELAPHVRVNAIAPSLTESHMAEPILSNEAMAKSLAKAHPLARLGTPEDQANAAAFLLSEESSWITGQIIGVDGGRSSL